MTLLKRIVLEKRTLITIVVMILAVDVLLYAFAVYPWSNKVVRAETRAVQAAAQLGLLRASYVAATQASENKINADSQLERFYSEVLPVDLAGARRISNPLLAKLAADTNLVLEQRRSVSETIRESLLARLRTTMVLAGAYEDIRQFIYELETAPEFILIEAVILSQADGSDEELVLTLGVSTYYWVESDAVS